MNQESGYFSQYQKPIEVDVANNIFGPVYEGDTKYALSVYPEQELTHAQISEAFRYVELVSTMTSEDYDAKVNSPLDQFVVGENVPNSALASIPSLAKWIFRYTYTEKDSDLDDEDRRIAKAIIVAIEYSVPTTNPLPVILAHTVQTTRSVVYGAPDTIRKWLDVVLKKTSPALMNRQIGSMNGHEFKAYLKHVGFLQ